ncbi:MAG: hypothetical protein Kow0042_16980 [Calditrichia bacterium]
MSAYIKTPGLSESGVYRFRYWPMTKTKKNISDSKMELPPFRRKFFETDEKFTVIGKGELGGKARGLLFARNLLKKRFDQDKFAAVAVEVPESTVITTDYFDLFMQRNRLGEVAFSDLPDYRIAHAFLNSELPTEILGDLRALIEKVHQPLAIRSSSLLEDALFEPFAGIYATKMIPNNQPDADTRFRRLVEAIKLVYASTYFRAAKNYLQATRHQPEEEKMAVIIQEVVGQRYASRFYPTISGVARSFNFYPIGHAKPEDGVLMLALGLGKIIVDEGIAWTCSPAAPRANPPYGSVKDLLKQTQTEFWAVNMGKLSVYDPVKETEYLIRGNLSDAELDNTLRFIASTYDPQSDRIYPGGAGKGIKLINFAPILHMEQIPLTEMIKALLTICREEVEAPVEIEFAMTLDKQKGTPARLGFLQLRPMVVSDQQVDIPDELLSAENVILASEHVLGNGIVEDIRYILFVKPETFDAHHTRQIAKEIEQLNRDLFSRGKPYLLIGFGRWGSSDPWLGIPVDWGQICGAKVIVESTLPEINVDLSQGTHFFHNISSFQVSYFSLHHADRYKIDWDWLRQQKVVGESQFVKLIELPSPLTVKVDGRRGRGVILK